jgi:hypothetical protein
VPVSEPGAVALGRARHRRGIDRYPLEAARPGAREPASSQESGSQPASSGCTAASCGGAVESFHVAGIEALSVSPKATVPGAAARVHVRKRSRVLLDSEKPLGIRPTSGPPCSRRNWHEICIKRKPWSKSGLEVADDPTGALIRCTSGADGFEATQGAFPQNGTPPYLRPSGRQMRRPPGKVPGGLSASIVASWLRFPFTPRHPSRSLRAGRG